MFCVKRSLGRNTESVDLFSIKEDERQISRRKNFCYCRHLHFSFAFPAYCFDNLLQMQITIYIFKADMAGDAGLALFQIHR
jgi:hypothetical protein